MHLQMDQFLLEAVALTGINKVVVSHDAYRPGPFSLFLGLFLNVCLHLFH